MRGYKKTKKRLMCEICRETLTTTSQKTHLCGSENSIQCEYCEERFEVTTQLLNHLHAVHSENIRLYRCIKCPKFLPMEVLRIYHQKSHGENEKLFTCDICSKNFSTKMLLRRHTVRRHTVRRHIVEKCE